ncbi:MFS transporter [soil metagenome]
MVATLGLAVAAVPVFLTGALAPEVRTDLALSETVLGAAVSTFFVVAGVGSVPGGRLADRVGDGQAIRIGSAVTAVALLVLATAQSAVQLVVGLGVGGLGIAVAEPGTAMVLARGVRSSRQGLAFGIKEAAIPTATLLAGAAVPTVALTAGWRWAYLVPLVGVAALWMAAPHRIEQRAEAPSPPPPAPRTAAVPRSFVIVALGAGLALGAMNAVGTFLVDSAVSIGIAPGTAGGLLVVGGAVGIAARLGIGVATDRLDAPRRPTGRDGPGGRPQGWSPLIATAALVAGGAIALALLGVATASGSSVALVAGTIGAFGVGWAWTGLYFLAAVRVSPDAPGAGTGVAMAGISAGAAVGPLLFGAAAGRWSYTVAWVGAAAMMAVASSVVLAGARRLR